MRIVRFGLLSCLLVPMFTWFGCSQKDPVITTIGSNRTVRVSAFLSDFEKRNTLPKGQIPSLQDYRNSLEQLINQEVKVAAAYGLGLEQDSSVEVRVSTDKQRMLLEALYKKEIIDPVITEKDIRDFYTRSGKEVLIRTIFLKTQPQMKPVQIDSIRAVAEGIYKRLQKGELFTDLARSYSQDETTAMNGGMVGSLDYSKSNDPIRNAAFSMSSGEFSKPIQTDLGFNIIKVEEVRSKERKPLDEERERIKDLLRREKGALLSERSKEYWEKWKNKSGFNWDEKTVDTLAAFLKNPKPFFRKGLLDRLDSIPKDYPPMVLVRYSDGQMKVSDFIARVKTMSFSFMGIPMYNKETLKHYAERWIMTGVLEKQALSKRLDRDPKVQEGLKQARERAMLGILHKTHIYGDIRVTPEQAKSYYEERKREKYSDPEMIRIREVQVRDLRLAEDIKNMASKKKDFAMLPKIYTVRPGMKQKNGEFTPFPRGRWGKLGEAAFGSKVGEITGPITLEDNSYSVFQVLQKIPPKVKPFDKIANMVMRDLTNEIQKEKETAWMKIKRNEIPVRINEVVLAGLVNEKKK